MNIYTSPAVNFGDFIANHGPTSLFAIDSSGTSTGWAELQMHPEVKVLRSGKIALMGNYPPKTRFQDVYEEIVIKTIDELEKQVRACKYPLFCCAIEETPYFRGGTVTKLLIGLYQMIRISIYRDLKIPVNPVNAKHAKAVFTGNGSASKKEVVDEVNKKFNLDFMFVEKGRKGDEFSNEDEADAIQAGYTLIHDFRYEG
jgi:Holliday junction resolvasome RuvABC endonuclease subunit